jgi:4-diphosphocytidyl-2-C-methyl-D-erythritol kinase
MIIFPNAKINLGLRVLERLESGFHKIETVFLPIGLSDILEFVDSGDDKTHIAVTGIPIDQTAGQNIVLKAWELMHSKYGIPAVNIYLHKVIPVGAGLGGGSADAAFMLNGLNYYYNCGATVDELLSMAAALGSDCSFFIRNRPAYATGRGEILEEIELPCIGYNILLVNLGIMISTREAYENIIPETQDIRLKDLIVKPVNEWKKLLVNDFEKSVFSRHPEIEQIKHNLLDQGAVYAAMSGSGSTVFGIFDQMIEINKFIKRFKGYFIWYGKLNSIAH